MRTFTYQFQDGTILDLEATGEALEAAEQEHGVCTWNGYRAHLEGITLLRANSHKVKTDGFQPGFHPGLGMEIRTHGQYQAELKARGMVEVGNDKQTYKPKEKSVFTDELIKEAVDKGASISGNEAAALVSGTYKSEAAE